MPEMLVLPPSSEIDVDVEMIVFDHQTDKAFLRLRVLDGAGTFGLAAGLCESSALFYLMADEKSAIPLTYNMTAALMERFDARLRDVVIDRFDEVQRRYCATLRLTHRGKEFELTVRPSDAIKLAVTCERPIRIRRDVIEAAAGRST